MWKEVPTVGGNIGGIPLQIINGETSFSVNTVKLATEKTLYILKHPEEAKMMGKKGKEHAKENFLVTRHLKKYLNLFLSLTESPWAIYSFGLGVFSDSLEDASVDLHLLKRALESTHFKIAEECFSEIFTGYTQIVGSKRAKEIFENVEKIRLRGRYTLRIDT